MSKGTYAECSLENLGTPQAYPFVSFASAFPVHGNGELINTLFPRRESGKTGNVRGRLENGGLVVKAAMGMERGVRERLFWRGPQ